VAVLLPFSLVAVRFGTNCELPEYDFLAPFSVLLIGMLALACGLLAFSGGDAGGRYGA
jgi:hypothetical protein